MSTKKQGPNVKKLVCKKMSLILVPAGTGSPFAHALGALTDPARLKAAAKEATEFVEAAIAVVKTAPDNPYGDDDEAIAAAILKGIEEREAQRGRVR